MKKILLLIAFCFSLIWADGFRPLTLEQAYTFAQMNDKNIVVYFDQQNWKPCRLMKQLTFENKSVQAWLRSNISLKITASNTAVIEQFNITTFPTILILDKNKQILQRIEAYVSANELLQIANAQIPKVELTIQGHHMAFLGKRLRATVIVENGHIPITRGRLNITTSPHLQILASEGNPHLSKTQAYINIGNLKTKEKRAYKVTFISKHNGKHCLQAKFTSNQVEKQAEHCTTWRGFPALLVEVIDTVDPITIGEETTYEVAISN